jgi:hypothetical protein
MRASGYHLAWAVGAGLLLVGLGLTAVLHKSDGITEEDVRASPAAA